jgi:hypothetical protein
MGPKNGQDTKSQKMAKIGLAEIVVSVAYSILTPVALFYIQMKNF